MPYAASEAYIRSAQLLLYSTGDTIVSVYQTFAASGSYHLHSSKVHIEVGMLNCKLCIDSGDVLFSGLLI